MAAVAPAVDQATDLLQNLSLGPKNDGEAKEAKEKVSSAVNGVVASTKPLLASAEQWASRTPQDYKDVGMYYGAYPYYCGGGWGDYSVYLSHDGAEALNPGAYGDMYCYPQYGVAASGHDGKIYGSQHYQYPFTYDQSQTTANKPEYKRKTGTSGPSPQEEVSTATADDQLPGLVDISKVSSNGTDGVNGQKKTTLPLKSNGHLVSYQNQGNKATYPWSGGCTFSEKQQRHSGGNPTSVASNTKTKGLLEQSSPMGPASPGFLSSIYSSSGMYNANAYGSGFWYGSHIYGPEMYGGWNALSNGKYRPRGKTYGSYGFGNESLDGLNELKRGPRSGLFKNQQGFGEAAVTPAKALELPCSNIHTPAKAPELPSSDIHTPNAVLQAQYNRADFVDTYLDAKFFIIKSYSEDDVHKSIKYNVWASTPNGNKKLDAAYQVSKESISSSPVFLFFSVNTSGQFVGLAEMVGQVDFNKTVDYWQQDKWTGCFPVKWHIVKDIPNNLLKHIILEYNENKPVTNSRDTQEVKLEQSLQMLKIFKDHVCKTSILDDFWFYDNREKIMKERKSRWQHPMEKIMNGKVLTTSNNEKVEIDGKQGQKKLAVAGEQNAVVENGAVAAPKDVNLTPAANGC